jgi:hypothetical protein
VDAYSGATADVLIDCIIVVGKSMMRKNNGRPPLAGAVLHVAWNLNEVFRKDNSLILGSYDDIMQMGMEMFIDGLALGETAKQWFPRTVVVIGGSAAIWKTSDVYNWYASAAHLGAMIQGHIVYSGEPLFASLAEQKKPDDPWRESWDQASPANAIVRAIARDCLMAQKVQSGAHFYEHHECDTKMGLCKIAATAFRSALGSADACRMGEQSSERSPSRWEDVHGNWERLPGSSPWTEGTLPKAQNFLYVPYEIPWKLIPWMKVEQGSLTIRITLSRQDIAPRWLLKMGLMNRSDKSITIGESVIMKGEGRNREIRSALLHLWLTNQEILYGFPGMVKEVCQIAMDARSYSETSSPIKWPGMEATTREFDTSVNAMLNEEQDTGY